MFVCSLRDPINALSAVSPLFPNIQELQAPLRRNLNAGTVTSQMQRRVPELVLETSLWKRAVIVTGQFCARFD